MVSYRGNQYSVPPESASAQVTVTRPVGSSHLDTVTASGITVARHAVAADSLRDSGHVIALERLAMATVNTGKPHRRKERIPPGPDALRAAEALRGSRFVDSTISAATAGPGPVSDVIDLGASDRAARGRNTLA